MSTYQDRAAAEAKFAQGKTPAYQPGGPWPEPDLNLIAHERAPAPRFPIELFGKRASAWISAAAESKGAPVDFVALPLLSSIGALLANHRRTQPWGGWTAPPIINTANVGLPSTNKSPAYDAVDGPIRELQDEMNQDFVQAVNAYYADCVLQKQARQTWENEVKEADKQNLPPPEMPEKAMEPQKPRLKRLSINDTTTEKLIRLSAENKTGLVWKRDELAGLFGTLDKYGGSSGSDRAVLLECFEGRSYAVDRVKDEGTPIMTPSLAVAIVGGIQPDRLNSMLLSGDDDGLAARFLYAWPERIQPSRPKQAPDNEHIKEAFRRLLDLDQQDGRARLVTFEEAAADALDDLRIKIAGMEDSASGLLLSWIGKVPGYVVRLSLIFEFLWWSFDRPDDQVPAWISGRAFADASSFMLDYALPMARRAFGDAALPQSERDAVMLAKWILAQNPRPETVNARALRRAGILSQKIPARYEAALAELVEAGWIRFAPGRQGENKGRAAKDYAVNPVVREAAS
ncbi:MAG TPA: DUF3987 domain-containing protein [Geminicoccus sp.]|jgi:hypothetical protein|uniref:DUF3987 domain-containing protein n=1 Tax=Geminicoccus sp. TaxID=2024832 RepID=UPI002E300303|nr:DUF3987 domain-containing protein [Geminicoccus sp.]HEX2526874.1 DUF3987 domain-containing protein [Geminicoccus sp.]